MQQRKSDEREEALKVGGSHKQTRAEAFGILWRQKASLFEKSELQAMHLQPLQEGLRHCGHCVDYGRGARPGPRSF